MLKSLVRSVRGFFSKGKRKEVQQVDDTQRYEHMLRRFISGSIIHQLDSRANTPKRVETPKSDEKEVSSRNLWNWTWDAWKTVNREQVIIFDRLRQKTSA